MSCPFCARPSLDGATCFACRSSHLLDGAIVALRFESPLRETVHRAKYGSDRRLAGWLATLLPSPPPSTSLVTSVPLHRSRLWWRGFNQAESIARSYSETQSLPYSRTLTRIRATESQAGLARAERLINVKNIFKALGKQNITSAQILIIDDVLTTGATLDACAAELKQAGAVKVWAAVLARHT
jgi:ComF family protein